MLARAIENCQAALSHTRFIIDEAVSHLQSLLDVVEIIYQYVSYDIMLGFYQAMSLKFLYFLRNITLSIPSPGTTRIVKKQLHSPYVSNNSVIGFQFVLPLLCFVTVQPGSKAIDTFRWNLPVVGLLTRISIPLVDGMYRRVTLSSNGDASICGAEIERNTVVGFSGPFGDRD